jgi:hypothetical protein
MSVQYGVRLPLFESLLFANDICRAWQQLSGANTMTYCIVYVFQMARITTGHLIGLSTPFRW